jgi:hypothetical protein
MASVSNKMSPLGLRALVVLGALLSLCVSDTVGPRLLPLPSQVGQAAERRQSVGEPGCSSAPTSGHPEVVRVAMTAPARKQAGAEQHTTHVTAHAAATHVSAPEPGALSSVQTTYSPTHAASANATRPRGRAPPLSLV